MTATRDRQSDLDTDTAGPVPWDQRAIFGAFRGLPWWGAVLLGWGLTVVTLMLDINLHEHPGRLFQGAYFVGCVSAVCWVRRRNLFGPMVQPPLILAITLPGVVYLTTETPIGSGLFAKVLTLGTPLINGFPTMAITTGVVVAIGLLRLYLQRDPARAKNKPAPADRTRKIGSSDVDGPEAAPARRPRADRPAADAAAGAGGAPRSGRRPRTESASARGSGPRQPRSGQRAGGGTPPPQSSQPRRRAEQPPRREQPPADRRQPPPAKGSSGQGSSGQGAAPRQPRDDRSGMPGRRTPGSQPPRRPRDGDYR